MATAARYIEAKIAELAEPICTGLGLSLWNVDYVKESGNFFLRVYIDSKNGEPITIGNCEAVSRKLDKMLDVVDIIKQAYTLEVSSPGIDRPLKKPEDYAHHTGESVDIKLYKAVGKVKQFQGRLLGLEDGIVTIEYDDSTTQGFQLGEIASCRLSVL